MGQVCNSKIYQTDNYELSREYSTCEFHEETSMYVQKCKQINELDENNINLSFINDSENMTIEEIINVIDALNRLQENLVCKKMITENSLKKINSKMSLIEKHKSEFMKKFFNKKYKKTEIFDDFYKLLGDNVVMVFNIVDENDIEQIKVRFENIFRENSNFELIKIFKISEKIYSTLFDITNLPSSSITIMLDLNDT